MKAALATPYVLIQDGVSVFVDPDDKSTSNRLQRYDTVYFADEFVEELLSGKTMRKNNEAVVE